MRAVVTGGAGFIGSHLAWKLHQEGVETVVLDDLSTGHCENIRSEEAGVLKLVQGSVADGAFVEQVCDRADVVFHLAAIASVPKTMADAVGCHAVNFVGTLNVLEAIRRKGGGKVVLASSAAVYGDQGTIPQRETDPLIPLSPYGVDKAASELACHAYFSSYGVRSTSLRFFNVYGPRQDPSSPYSGVISLFANAAVGGDGVRVYGNGEQSRDFVFVGDVVEALFRAGVDGMGDGAVLNIGTGRAFSLNLLLNILRELSGSAIPAWHCAPRQGDIRHSVADIERAGAVLGWRPVHSLRGGLEKYLESL